VLITGASSGIGRALAVDLAGRGVTVVAGVRKAGDAPTGDGAPGRIHEVLLDVTRPDQIERATGTVRRRLAGQRLRAVVNNAAVGLGGPLEFLAMDDLRRQFEVNLFGQLAVTQAFIEPLRAHGDGRVLFVSSLSGRVAAPFTGPYAASKHALDALAECLRRELRPWRIQVSVLVPGAVATPIWGKARDAAESQLDRLPPAAVRLYGDGLAAMRRYVTTVAPARAVPPEAVVRAARKALYARRPRATYLIGADTRAVLTLSRALPTHAFDALLARLTR
jgi:NAD(P)-dependent dehydrogenase (short-subunit alcohol dehydrogenase family)